MSRRRWSLRSLSQPSAEDSTASDHRRTQAPRGRRDVTPQMLEGVKMLATHTYNEVAAKFGVSTQRVYQWTEIVAQRRAIERLG